MYQTNVSDDERESVVVMVESWRMEDGVTSEVSRHRNVHALMLERVQTHALSSALC